MKYIKYNIILIIIYIIPSYILWDNQEDYVVPRTVDPEGNITYHHNPLHMEYYKNKECVTSFECWKTGCCKEGICVNNSECEKTVNQIYIIIGICSSQIFIFALIYSVYTIQEAKKKVDKIKQHTQNKESHIKNKNK